MAKIGQDQHLKLSPKSLILFYKVFFDKKHSKLPQTLITELKPRPLFKKNRFLWSNPYKIEVMVTSHRNTAVTKFWSNDHIYNTI